MINEQMRALGAAPNEIRATFAYGLKRKAEIGEDKVFDLSIGNPSVPTPPEVDQAIIDYVTETKGMGHGYTMSQGLDTARAAIADNINRRFGTNYNKDNFFLTSGAAGSLAISLAAVVQPGEEVIVVAPYFSEYSVWVANIGAKLVEVPARQSDFQMDVPATEAAINEKTAVVLINTPNNPVGAIYSEDNLKELAEVLTRKSQEYGHPIYLLSDEPYRELYYEEDEKPSWVPFIYPNTIIAYSWSKSMSLPGDRIAYILVPSEIQDMKDIYYAVGGAARSLGYVCASATFQNVVARCVDVPVNKEPYAINRKAFMDGLDKIGYTYVKPQGAFYMWIKALEPDAVAFCERAKAHELLLVPSDGFGVKGWVRAGYCCSLDTIEGSMAAFQEVWDEYHK